MLPRYKCHKEVRAFKIARIDHVPYDNFILIPCTTDLEPVRVNGSYMKKHDPRAGGYFVVYDDGYESFSPAEAFEAGYTLIEEEKA